MIYLLLVYTILQIFVATFTQCDLPLPVATVVYKDVSKLLQQLQSPGQKIYYTDVCCNSYQVHRDLPLHVATAVSRDVSN